MVDAACSLGTKAATSISMFLQISLVYVFHHLCWDYVDIFAMTLLGDGNIYQLVGRWERVIQIYKLFVGQSVVPGDCVV